MKIVISILVVRKKNQDCFRFLKSIICNNVFKTIFRVFWSILTFLTNWFILGEVYLIQHYVIVCQWLATGRWFFPGIPLSSTYKTDRYDITEILYQDCFRFLKSIICNNVFKTIFRVFWSILTFLTNWFYIWIRNVLWKQTCDALYLFIYI
jgi:ribosome biogenesis protein Nip4